MFGQQPGQVPWMDFKPVNFSSGGGGGGLGDVGQRILQAALGQKRQQQAALAAQPQVGQGMPGGAMNISPPIAPQQPMGMLSNLFRRMGGGGMGGMPAPMPMDSSNAIY